MIHITDKSTCCGCSACVQRCPKQCISMSEDEEGFLYPIVDSSLCINCGLCEKVCPVTHQSSPKQPQSVYAAINPNEHIRKNSSSGGIFTLLAERIIEMRHTDYYKRIFSTLVAIVVALVTSSAQSLVYVETDHEGTYEKKMTGDRLPDYNFSINEYGIFTVSENTYSFFSLLHFLKTVSLNFNASPSLILKCFALFRVV